MADPIFVPQPNKQDNFIDKENNNQSMLNNNENQ